MIFFLFLSAKICHAITSCNTVKTTWIFVIYDLWFHEFVLLKPTLNNLTTLGSNLTLEFIFINYHCFKVLLFLWLFFFVCLFFWFNKCQKTWEKQFMKPQNFCNCGGPWRLQHLSFFTNHLKLVNLIPQCLTFLIKKSMCLIINTYNFTWGYD